MKKFIVSMSLCSSILSLMSCGSSVNTEEVNPVTKNAIKTGVGYGGTTEMIETDVGDGVAVLTGRVSSYKDFNAYRRDGIIYHNGHAYKIQQGKYVLIN